LISGGGLANLNRQGVRLLRSGMFVINPVLPGTFGSSGRITLRLATRSEPASVIPASWRRMSGELRWLRHVTRKALRVAAPSVERILSVRDGNTGRPKQQLHGNVTELEPPSPARSPLLVIIAPISGAIPTLESATSH
jgi:hypothetical protein